MSSSPQPRCPICEFALAEGAASDSAVYPFCSARCRQIDLLRWCNGQYAVVEPLEPWQLRELLGDEEQDSPGV